MKKATDTDTTIPIKELASGLHHYAWTLTLDFFTSFENQDIIDAHVDAKVALDRQVDRITLEATLVGSAVRPCDRCLGNVTTPISCYDKETILLNPTDTQLNLSQYLYDTVCVNLPIQSLHPQGQCDPFMEQKLAQLLVN